MSKVEALGAAAVEAAHRAARAAVEAVFDAITAAAEAAANYVSALYRAVASAAAEAYAEVKRVVAQACDAVKRAASCVSSRVVELIECLHGVTAAAWAKTKLDGVNGFVRAGDVASLVAAILDGIKRASTQFVPPESSKVEARIVGHCRHNGTSPSDLLRGRGYVGWQGPGGGKGCHQRHSVRGAVGLRHFRLF